MGSFNRGEWSEIYAIVSLLLHPELSIGNAELEELTNSLYNLKKIKINDPNSVGIIEYAVNNTDDVEVFYDDMLKNLISRVELEESKKVIFDGINNAPIGSGAFEIQGIEQILKKLTKGKLLKSKSLIKEDFEAKIFDNSLGKDFILKYSIKSSLGSPASLLNSSAHTDFYIKLKISILNLFTMLI